LQILNYTKDIPSSTGRSKSFMLLEWVSPLIGEEPEEPLIGEEPQRVARHRPQC